MFLYRQGDVLLIPISNLPQGLTPIDPVEGRLILAEGEVTGHAHAILESDARLYTDGTDQFLALPSGGCLLHEEHTPHALPPGFYRQVTQRQYTPEENPIVTD